MPPVRPQLILERLARLKPESTMCPGQLAKEFGSTQHELRPLYLQLAREGKLAITQGGTPVRELGLLKGAFRIRLPRPEDEAWF